MMNSKLLLPTIELKFKIYENCRRGDKRYSCDYIRTPQKNSEKIGKNKFACKWLVDFFVTIHFDSF